MIDIRTYYLAAACCILPLSPFAPALADADEPPEEGGERCIDTRRIIKIDACATAERKQGGNQEPVDSCFIHCDSLPEQALRCIGCP